MGTTKFWVKKNFVFQQNLGGGGKTVTECGNKLEHTDSGQKLTCPMSKNSFITSAVNNKILDLKKRIYIIQN